LLPAKSSASNLFSIAREGRAIVDSHPISIFPFDSNIENRPTPAATNLQLKKL